MLHKGEEHGAICTFPLDHRNKVKQIQICVNEQLSCLIHLKLYKTRATIIYAFIDIYLFLIKSLASKFKVDLFPGHFKGAINKVENDELFCIFCGRTENVYALRG